MTPIEVRQLLAGLKLMQPMWTSEQEEMGQIALWDQTLNDTMDYAWAMQHVAQHFARHKTRLDPADFNKAWAEHRQALIGHDHQGDAGWRDAPVQFPPPNNGRATPEVVELCMAAYRDMQDGKRVHPDGTPFSSQDYLDEVIPMMKAAAVAARENPIERHCGRSGCPCIHDRGCYKGWMEGPGYDPDKAVPCGVCRSDLSHRLSLVPGPGERAAADQATLRAANNANDAY